MVEFLLNSGVDVNAHCGHWGTALIGASCKGHVAIVRLLLKYGADIHQQDARYGNAVQAACCTDRVLLVDLWVLTDGIKPNADDEGFMNGWTVLHKYHPKVIKLLLENGADINARGGKHGSAIQAAWDRGHDKTVDFLIRRGANESGLIRRPRYKFCGPPECLEPSESSDSMSDTQSEL
jgi:ankyrin repeat protein